LPDDDPAPEPPAEYRRDLIFPHPPASDQRHIATGSEAATNAAELATSERRTTTDTGSDGTTYTLDPMDAPSRRTYPLTTVKIRPTIGT